MRLAASFALLTLCACLPAAEPFSAGGLRLNQIQVIGTHNSYKQRLDAPLLDFLKTVNAAAIGFDYSHPPLNEQLDLGVRSLELDLYHDPDGGLYATPRGLELVRRLGKEPAEYDSHDEMKAPGFKVLHVADVDFRSSCMTLESALKSLREWSERCPDHLPIVVTMNLKDERTPFPDSTKPEPFDRAAFDSLDEALRKGLGQNRLITPDAVRGDFPTLENAVLERGWPRLNDLRGRYLWVMDERGAKHDTYLDGHPSLRGRVLFTTSEPGTPEAAVLIINDPIEKGSEIRQRVEQGYLVRTRADAETAEARRGDRRRFEAAQASGAQIISTDYPRPDKRLGTGYSVSFEGGAYTRRNPVTAAALSIADPVEPADE